MSTDNIKPIVVFAGSAWEANLMKSLLEDAEIQTYLQDEYIGTIAPWQAAAGGEGAVKVIVSSDDVEDAQKVIDEYRQAQSQ